MLSHWSYISFALSYIVLVQKRCTPAALTYWGLKKKQKNKKKTDTICVDDIFKDMIFIENELSFLLTFL